MTTTNESEGLRVAVVGLGYVGSCIAATLANRGMDVLGVDIDPGVVESLRAGYSHFREEGLPDLLRSAVDRGTLSATDDYSHIDADVIVIAVGTPVGDDGSLNDRQLRRACSALGPRLRRGQLVILKSTVPPGTTRELVAPLLETGGLRAGVDFRLAFTPERLAEGNALREVRTFPIVVGGITEESASAAHAFWRRALDVEVVKVQSLEAAEIVKLADNWWIDLNIALANELAKYCALFGVDSLEVIEAANGIPKGSGSVNILLPGVGVGGSCLTKDPWMVWHSAHQRGLDIRTAVTGRAVNDGMPRYTVDRALRELSSLGKDPAECVIAVLGLAFKNNTGDLRATPTLDAVDAFREAGATVRLHDPLADPVEVEALFGQAPAASMEETVRDADCIAILAMHREFEDVDFATLDVAPKCLVLDGRAYLPRQRIRELKNLGYAYQGIGR